VQANVAREAELGEILRDLQGLNRVGARKRTN
jgi:hypothetical protein